MRRLKRQSDLVSYSSRAVTCWTPSSSSLKASSTSKTTSITGPIESANGPQPGPGWNTSAPPESIAPSSENSTLALAGPELTLLGGLIIAT